MVCLFPFEHIHVYEIQFLHVNEKQQIHVLHNWGSDSHNVQFHSDEIPECLECYFHCRVAYWNNALIGVGSLCEGEHYM